MPIECPLVFQPVADTVFDAVDERVMACAYAAHNVLGRLCEERVYENELAARLEAAGVINIYTQTQIAVCHRTFRKTYRVDLAVNGVVYELKVADCFVPGHEAQCIHYGALLELNRIKLLNFGSASVHGRLLRCPFARIDRRLVTVDRSRWRPQTERCTALANDAEACLRDWGGFLDPTLFSEALVFFNGGETTCVHRLPVTRAGLLLGHHRTNLHAQGVAFTVTALGIGAADHERHLRKLLELLPIQCWQWINIHHTKMNLVTLAK